MAYGLKIDGESVNVLRRPKTRARSSRKMARNPGRVTATSRSIAGSDAGERMVNNRPSPSVAKAQTTATGRTTVPGQGGYSPGVSGGVAGASGVAPSPGVAGPPAGPPPTYDLEALQKMLAGIEAQYGVDKAQLIAGQGEASDLYRFILANLGAAQLQAQSAVQEGGIRRGILRSGIAAEEQAQVANQFAQQKAEAVGNRDQKLAEIALLLQKLDADLQKEKTNTAVNYAQTNLGTDEALAQALLLV